MVQVRLIASARRRIGVINLGPIDLLKSLHRADGADELEIGVVAKQVTDKIKSQWRNAIRRHEIADPQPHFFEILVGRRELILPVFDTQYRMLIVSSVIGFAA